MLTRILAVSALVIATGIAFTQTDSSLPKIPSGPSVPQAAHPEKSIDQLLDDVEKLRIQKAELEKREQEMVQEIWKKLEKQADRITQLGIVESKLKTPAVAPPLTPVPVTPVVAPQLPMLP